MGRLRRSRVHKNNKFSRKMYATKRRTKDLDQIVRDLKPENMEKLKEQPINDDLPGRGQFYCITCAGYYISEKALESHLKSRPHKRRLAKLLSTKEKDFPWTVEDSRLMAVDNGPSHKQKNDEEEQISK